MGSDLAQSKPATVPPTNRSFTKNERVVEVNTSEPTSELEHVHHKILILELCPCASDFFVLSV